MGADSPQQPGAAGARRPADRDDVAFVELDPDQCRAVLSAGSIGRVGWTSARGQLILPVTYAFLGGSIGFRTSPYATLSELVRPTEVAFEVDRLDHEHGAGESVLVQGTAQAADTADWAPPAWAGEVMPWAGGNRKLLIEITIRTISGRAIRPRS